MDLMALAQMINDSGIGTAIREQESLFAYIEVVHVIAIAAVVGSIAVVDLRLLGFAWAERPISQIESEILPYTWGAFAGAVASGGLLFSSHATEYVVNPYFVAKMALLVLAGLNMLAFHFITERTRANWDAAARMPVGVKVAGAVSLLFWISIIACGRWIGFYLDQARFGS